MAHSYRALQHWNQWTSQEYLGCHLMHTEQTILKTLLNKHFGKHAVLIGVPHQYHLLEASEIPCHTLITPIIHRDKNITTIESDLRELPILTGSIDLVMLPHTLEFIDHPRQLLAEACRIIKPQGLIVILGFNPYSAWGAKQLLFKTKKEAWYGNLIQSRKIKSWLQLADFELEAQKHMLYRPPTEKRSFFERMAFLEKVGPKIMPSFGSVYILLARAKVIPLTPIKMKWKQQLGNIRITPGITGQIRVASK